MVEIWQVRHYDYVLSWNRYAGVDKIEYVASKYTRKRRARPAFGCARTFTATLILPKKDARAQLLGARVVSSSHRNCGLFPWEDSES